MNWSEEDLELLRPAANLLLQKDEIPYDFLWAPPSVQLSMLLKAHVAEALCEGYGLSLLHLRLSRMLYKAEGAARNLLGGEDVNLLRAFRHALRLSHQVVDDLQIGDDRIPPSRINALLKRHGRPQSPLPRPHIQEPG